MKKLFILFAATVIGIMALSSCQKADSWSFDYPQEVLCGGVWQGIAVKSDGKWTDITNPIYSKLQFSIKFNTDGTYYGAGYFGNGCGTYKAYGKTIDTFIDGEIFYTYSVISMSGTDAELRMSSRTGDSLDIRVHRN